MHYSELSEIYNNNKKYEKFGEWVCQQTQAPTRAPT